MSFLYDCASAYFENHISDFNFILIGNKEKYIGKNDQYGVSWRREYKIFSTNNS